MLKLNTSYPKKIPAEAYAYLEKPTIDKPIRLPLRGQKVLPSTVSPNCLISNFTGQQCY